MKLKLAARAVLSAALLVAAAAAAPHVVNVTAAVVGNAFRIDNATYTDGLVLDDVGNATVVLNATSIAGAGLVVRGGVGATGSLQLTNGTRVEATTAAAAALSVECLAGRLVVGPGAVVSASSAAAATAVVNVTVCGGGEAASSAPASLRLDGATLRADGDANNASVLAVAGAVAVDVARSTVTGSGSTTTAGREFVTLAGIASLAIASSTFTSAGSGVAVSLAVAEGTATVTSTDISATHGTALVITGPDAAVSISTTAVTARAPANSTHDMAGVSVTGCASATLRDVVVTCAAAFGSCSAAAVNVSSANASLQRTVSVAGTSHFVARTSGVRDVAALTVLLAGARSTCTLVSLMAVSSGQHGHSGALVITGDGSAEQAVALTTVRVNGHHEGLSSDGGLQLSNLGPRSTVAINGGSFRGPLVGMDLFDLPHSTVTMTGVVSTTLNSFSNANVKIRGNLAGTAVTLANVTAVSSRSFITALLVAPSAARPSAAATDVLRVTVADSDLNGDTSLTLDTAANVTTVLAVTDSKLVGPCRLTPGDHSVVTMERSSITLSNFLARTKVALALTTAAENVTASLTAMTVSSSTGHGPVALRVALAKSAAAPSSLTVNGGTFTATGSLFTTSSTVSATAAVFESTSVDASRTLTPTVVVTGATFTASARGGTVRGVWVDTAAASSVRLVDSRVSATSVDTLLFTSASHWASAAAYGAVVGPAASAAQPDASAAAVVADLRIVNTTVTARARLAGGAVMLSATAPVTPRLTITGGSVTVDVDAPAKGMTAGIVALPQTDGGDAAATTDALRDVTISAQGVAFASPVRGTAVYSGVPTCVVWLPQTMPGVWRVTVSNANVTGAGFRPQPVLCRTPNGTAPISAATQVCLLDTQRVYTEDSKTTTLAATLWDVPESLRGRVSAACALPASKAPPSETKSLNPGIDVGDLGLNDSPSTTTVVIIVVVVGVVGCGCVGGIALISWCVCCRESRVPHRSAPPPASANGAPVVMAGQQMYPQQVYPPQQQQMQQWSNGEVEMTQPHPGVPVQYKPSPY